MSYFFPASYLESNEITSISADQLRHLTQLTRLDLSNNKITVLSNNTFEALTKLSTLIVSYNRLRCVQVTLFNNKISGFSNNTSQISISQLEFFLNNFL